jgi:hypothetical protein
MEEVKRVNSDLENNWWNYEIYLKERIESNGNKEIEKEKK